MYRFAMNWSTYSASTASPLTERAYSRIVHILIILLTIRIRHGHQADHLQVRRCLRIAIGIRFSPAGENYVHVAANERVRVRNGLHLEQKRV